MENEETTKLRRRADDMIRQTARGIVTKSPFLSPREAHTLSVYLGEKGYGKNCFFWGGYPEAERTRLFLLPGYLTELIGADTERDFSFEEPEPDVHTKEGYPVGLIDRYTDGLITEAVAALYVKGSGYRDLSHRDYLGSLLALGLERDVLGDIVPDGDFSAVVFCDGRIAGFLRENLRRVGNDAVKLTEYTVPDGFTGNQRLTPIRTTVASERLDCVIAALTGLSREAAQTAVRSGLCEVEFETETKPDRTLIPPCRLSMRGYGRYQVYAFEGETKKGRLRISAGKFV